MTAVVIARQLVAAAAQDVGRRRTACSGQAARIDAEKAVAGEQR